MFFMFLSQIDVPDGLTSFVSLEYDGIGIDADDKSACIESHAEDGKG